MPRTKKKKNRYFTQEHEDAIVRYSAIDCKKERTELYIKFIGPVFDEMVDKIVYTYKFNNLPNIDSLKDECKIWLTTILDKFEPSKGSKAFSYFSVITKNWFIHKVKKNSKSVKKEVSYEDIMHEAEADNLVTHHPYIRDREDFEFWQHFWQEITSWEEMKLKETERRVLEAVKILFTRKEELEIFNKKAIYLYMREITGLNTKQIVNNLNKMRARYRVFKRKWEEGKI